jgi:hypothetical protein
MVGRRGDPSRGARLIVVAGVHGNEPGGVIGATRVLEALDPSGADLAGELVVVVGNRTALGQGVRFVEEDLNRLWTRPRVEALRVSSTPPAGVEEREQWELLHVLDELLSDPIPQVVLDLHSTSGPGGPFACISDTLKARELALSLPVPLLLGIEESIRGTLLDHLEHEGRTMLLIEGGQHDDPHTPDHLETLIWMVMDRLSLLPPGLLAAETHAAGERRLRATTAPLPRVLEVRHRHGVTPDERFRMNPGHGNFEQVRAGQPLAESRSGTIVAPESGYLIMPLYQPQGSDGFFLARAIRPAWLRVSTLFRFLAIDRILPRLPGVHPDPHLPLRLEVDPAVARWGTIPLFRLAGFRRLPDRDGKLRFTRRVEP